MPKTRIYIVAPTAVIDGKLQPGRLIDAITPAQAIRHVTKDAFTIQIATPHQIAKMIKNGIALETASEEVAPPPELPFPKTETQQEPAPTPIQMDVEKTTVDPAPEPPKETEIRREEAGLARAKKRGQ